MVRRGVLPAKLDPMQHPNLSSRDPVQEIVLTAISPLQQAPTVGYASGWPSGRNLGLKSGRRHHGHGDNRQIDD